MNIHYKYITIVEEEAATDVYDPEPELDSDTAEEDEPDTVSSHTADNIVTASLASGDLSNCVISQLHPGR